MQTPKPHAPWPAELRAALTRIATEPLALCPDFPEIAQRWEAWWRFDADRPLLWGSVARPGAAPPPAGPAFGRVGDPPRWLEFQRRQLEARQPAGDTIPAIRVDIGPVTLAAMLGAPLHFAEDEYTSWQDPIIETWSQPPPLDYDPDQRWVRTVAALVEHTAENARGRYAVCLPDLGGALDVLSNLRRPDRLCLDLFEHRDAIRAAASRIVNVWEQVALRLYRAVLSRGAPLIHWLGCWSNVPYALPTCDFSFMISPEDYRDVCLPSLHEQAARAGRAVYHLDGAPRHAEALIEDPAITAIQYTPGDGTPSALALLDMFKRIQAAGKPVIATCPAEEVPELCRKLDRRGLVLRPSPLRSREQAQALMQTVSRAAG
jgi:hypothetical protein